MSVYFIKLLGKLPVGEESYANEESNAQDMGHSYLWLPRLKVP